MNRLGIENLSIFGLPPVDYVNLVADLGCANMSLGLAAIHTNPHDYPRWNLREDAALRRAVAAALNERGVALSLGEGFGVRPGSAASDSARDLDIFAELGAERINMVSLDPDRARTLDEFARLAEMAAERGIASLVEFSPRLMPNTLADAAAVIAHVGRPDFRLTVDTMHLVRTGSGAADVAALDPALIGYIQLCDVPLVSRFETYLDEAMTERRAPGDGELPLLEIMRALPRDLPVGLEVPLLSQAQAGVGPYERLKPVVEAARALLAELD